MPFPQVQDVLKAYVAKKKDYGKDIELLLRERDLCGFATKLRFNKVLRNEGTIAVYFAPTKGGAVESKLVRAESLFTEGPFAA